MEFVLAIALAVALAACAWLIRERWQLAAENKSAESRRDDLEAQRTTFQALAAEALRSG